MYALHLSLSLFSCSMEGSMAGSDLAEALQAMETQSLKAQGPPSTTSPVLVTSTSASTELQLAAGGWCMLFYAMLRYQQNNTACSGQAAVSA
jgi:hypothetical protein